MITAQAVPGLPEVRPGDDLARLLAGCREFRRDEVLVLSQKVVSKAEGRIVELGAVEPTERAYGLAADLGGKDAQLVDVVLGETEAIVRAERGVLICRTHHGFVCANAGVDRSNTEPGTAVLLPVDADASARALRARLGCAVVIADSFGRAWRNGQADIAIGAAGIAPIDDWRGLTDGHGNQLAATAIAIADEAAAAADLARGGKDAGHAAVVLTGLERHLLEEDGPGAGALVRARSEDLFL